MIEKKEGYGEDSIPLLLVKEDFYAVGVFDGMGGSGAAICKSDYGDNHTKAYVASRIIQESICRYIENIETTKDINSEGIRHTAKYRLEQERSHYPTKVSGLRSKLVRDYPTTIAITTASKNEDETYTINSYWAGDSRNYLWTTDGFFQISKDDLDTELDPLENLRNDGALSNCVCADRDFRINNKTIQVVGKFIILSATDGCFNYFTTPMHFHAVLLTGLKQSNSVEEWKIFCKDEFSLVTGDDVSISLLAVGFNDFDELKKTFMQSTITGIEEIKNIQDDIKELSSKLESAKESLEAIIQSEWNVYKISYMKYFSHSSDKSAECYDDISEKLSSENPLGNNSYVPTADGLEEIKTADKETSSSDKDETSKIIPESDTVHNE